MVRERTGLPGFAVGGILLLIGSFYLLRAIIGVAGTVIGTSSVGTIASLIAFAYTAWVTLNAHEQYSDRTRAATISERPSIDTAEDAFELLTSADTDAREYAADCVSSTVSLGPSKVLTVLRTDPETVVGFIIPYLRSGQEAVQVDVALALSFFARDYPEAVSVHSEALLDLLEEAELPPTVRAEIATSVGFLSLGTTDIDTERVERKGLELAGAVNPDIRIAACYMLAGVGSDSTRDRLKELAENDDDEEVRAHAGELY
jgi:HEAT repeat protein